MPARNTTRKDSNKTYYHVYGRSTLEKQLFRERDDYIHFQYLAGRYLSSYKASNIFGRPFPNYYDSIELLSYCLLSDEFHLLIYQKDAGQLARFMASILTSYSRYYNNKYQLSGALLRGRYKSTTITSSRLQEVSRYIHRKPEDWQNHPYSSLRYFYSEITSSSARPAQIEAMFRNKQDYIDFLNNTADFKTKLAVIQSELADH